MSTQNRKCTSAYSRMCGIYSMWLSSTWRTRLTCLSLTSIPSAEKPYKSEYKGGKGWRLLYLHLGGSISRFPPFPFEKPCSCSSADPAAASLFCLVDRIRETKEGWQKALHSISDVSLPLVVSKCQRQCVCKSNFFSPSLCDPNQIHLW